MVKSICGCEDGGILRGRGHEKRYMGDTHEAVKRARDDQRAVPVEMHGGHVVEMGVQRFGASPCVGSADPTDISPS